MGAIAWAHWAVITRCERPSRAAATLPPPQTEHTLQHQRRKSSQSSNELSSRSAPSLCPQRIIGLHAAAPHRCARSAICSRAQDRLWRHQVPQRRPITGMRSPFDEEPKLNNRTAMHNSGDRSFINHSRVPSSLGARLQRCGV